MYQDDDRITPYDGAVEIPKEIQTIRDPIIFNLTKRELLFVAVGILLAASSVWVFFKVLGVRSAGFMMIPAAVMIFAMRKYIGPEAIAGGFKMK